MFAADRDIRRSGLDILAVYHSHPISDPIPSQTDLAYNYSPQVINFIISLKGEPPVLRGWWLTETDFREADWEFIE
jgi:proteasome lid subunit RPN8/RPN11